MLDYFKDHWYGRQSLAWSFWINGMGLNLAAELVVRFIPDDLDIFTAWPFLTALIAFAIVLSIWSWVGIWRAARFSKVRPPGPDGKRKSRFWAYAAQGVVVISVLYTLFALIIVSIDLKRFIVGIKPVLEASYSIERVDRNAIGFKGILNRKSVHELIEAFEQEPSRRALFISSEGGLLDYAFDLADFVREHEIAVVAQKECISACLLVLSAAPDRRAKPYTALIFHRPMAVAEFVSQEAKDALAEQTAEYYRRLRSYGVAESSLRQFRKTEFTPLTIEQARAHNLIDGVWSTESQ